jgi:hypothetical protein
MIAAMRRLVQPLVRPETYRTRLFVLTAIPLGAVWVSGLFARR